MQNRRRLFPLLVLSFSLPSLHGCAKFAEKFSRLTGGHTLVTVANQHTVGTATLEGGIMVYAIRTTDGLRRSLKIGNEAQSGQMELPNGSYRFTAVGWPTAGLVGPVRCGGPETPLTLNGNNVTVPISLTAANCANDIYGSEPVYRSNSTLRPLNIKFCGGIVTLASLTSSSNCNLMQESTRFFRGDNTAWGVDHVEIDTVTGRLVYLADMHFFHRNELFSTQYTGGYTVKQSGIGPSGSFSVNKFSVVPGTGKVIYQADQNNSGVDELFISTIGQPGGSLVGSAVSGGGTGVENFVVTPNGARVILVGDMDGGGQIEVYSVDLATNVMTKLSAASPVGSGVQLMGSDWPLEVTANSLYAVFSGRFDSSARTEMYAAPTGGSANSAIKLSGTSPYANFSVSDFKTSADSTYVVWKGNYTAASTYDLYRATVNDDDSSVKINPASTADGLGGKFVLAHDGSSVAFPADLTAFPGKYHLYTSSLASPSAVQVHTATSNGVQFQDITYSTDNTKLAYFADPNADSVYRVYSATVGSAASATDRTHASASSIPISVPGTGQATIRTRADGSVVYRAATTTFSTNYGLYKFSFSDAIAGTLVSQALAASKAVSPGFGLDDTYAFYALDQITTGVNQLFRLSPAGSPNPTEIPVLTAGHLEHVVEVHVPETTVAAYLRMLALSGRSITGSTADDIYALLDYNAPGSLRKLSRAYDHAAGVGRFKVTLLEYKTEGGNVVEVGTGISSDCFTGPSSNGYGVDLGSSSVAFPAGNGTNSGLFALALDIYPEALDCTGSPQRTIFPYGLANASASSNSAKLKLTDSGSGPILFVKD